MMPLSAQSITEHPDQYAQFRTAHSAPATAQPGTSSLRVREVRTNDKVAALSPLDDVSRYSQPTRALILIGGSLLLWGALIGVLTY